MAVDVVAGTVLAHGRTGVGATGGDLHVAQVNVARQAMRDTTARHLVNRAQYEHDHEAGERAREIVRPARERVQHTIGFIDLIAACSAFVAAGGRIVPNLSARPFNDDERAAIHRNVARVRATAGWIEHAADTGNTSLADPGGLLVSVLVTAASVQDRDAARDLFAQPRQDQPQVACAWADSAYAGPLVSWAADVLDLTLAIVARPAGAAGFVLLPRRWGRRKIIQLAHERTQDREGLRAAARAFRKPISLGPR